MSQGASESTITVVSAVDHFRTRSMWIGSSSMSETNEILYTPEKGFYAADIEYPPAFLQMLMELMTNVSDHRMRHPSAVTAMTVKFANGVITVSNNGPGIPVTKFSQELISAEYRDATRDIYTPEIILRVPYSGTNFDDSVSRVSGGTNGLGMKIIVANSDKVIITTVWKSPSGEVLRYKQRFLNGGDIVEPPAITQVSADEREGTIIAFTPRYAESFKLSESEKNAFIERVVPLIHARVMMMAAWFPADVHIAFNGVAITINDGIAGLGHMIYRDTATAFMAKKLQQSDIAPVEPEGIFSTMITYGGLPWHIGIVVGYCGGFKPPRISLVNGLVVRDGHHFDRVEKCIQTGLTAKLAALSAKNPTIKIQPRFVNDSYTIYMHCTIDKPEFPSQTKTSLSLPTKRSKDAPQLTPIHPDVLDRIGDSIMKTIENHVLPELFTKTLNANIDKQKKAKCDYEKYESATLAGSKRDSQKCFLFLAEGDSAMAMVKSGINDSKSKLDTAHYGIFSVAGVPPNLRRVVHPTVRGQDGNYHKLPTNSKGHHVTTSENGDQIADIVYVMDGGEHSQRIYDNTVFKNLEIALGIVRGVHYPNGNRDNVRYGGIIVVVDRDLDGIGNIHGLIVNHFNLFWPELLDQGFVKVMLTPVVRAIPKYKKDHLRMIEFGLQREFEKWFDELSPEKQKRYEIEYYKGLAAHDKLKTLYMFRNFEKYLVTYLPGEDFDKTINLYFGADTELRKVELAKPIMEFDEEMANAMNTTRVWYGVHHLNVETKSFQHSNLQRKLINAIDGFVVSRRKLLYGGLRHKQKSKVFQLVGIVSAEMKYHHGSASLCATLIGMAQKIPGVNRYPFFLAGGQFGTLLGTSKGIGTDFGAPRYISTTVLTPFVSAIFRPEDMDILPPSMEDGARVEPHFMMPIIPTALIESHVIPSHGWKIDTHARKMDDIIRATRACIKNGSTDGIKIILGIDLSDLNCTLHIHSVNGKQRVAGRYTLAQSGNDIVITVVSLPPRFGILWYAKTLRDRLADTGAEVTTPGGEDNIQICIKLPKVVLQAKYDEYTASRASDLANIVANWSGEGPAPTSEYEPPIDSLVEILGLYTTVHNLLNFIVPDDPLSFTNQKVRVKSYRLYSEIFRDWFAVRKEYYSFRIDRECEVLAIQIEFYRHKLRFIELYKAWAADDDKSDADLLAFITANKFPRYNEARVMHAGPARAADVRALCVDHSTMVDELEDANSSTDSFSYNYLLNIRTRDRTSNNLARLQKQIDDRQATLDALMDPARHVPFKGAQDWLDELDHLEKTIAYGKSTKWAFDYDVSEYFE